MPRTDASYSIRAVMLVSAAPKAEWHVLEPSHPELQTAIS